MDVEQALKWVDEITEEEAELYSQPTAAARTLAAEVRQLQAENAALRGEDLATTWRVGWTYSRPGFHNPIATGVCGLPRAEAIALAAAHIQAGHDNVSLTRAAEAAREGRGT